MTDWCPTSLVFLGVIKALEYKLKVRPQTGDVQELLKKMLEIGCLKHEAHIVGVVLVPEKEGPPLVRVFVYGCVHV